MAYNWENTCEYKRILEILYDYWLSEPDEKEVRVAMYFEHADGQTQEKQIIWRNAKYLDSDPEGNAFMTVSEILNEADLFMPTFNMIDDDNLNGWVLCKDRLPEEQYKKCLVVIDGVKPNIDTVYWLMGEWEQREIQSDGYVRRMNITDLVIAWMPLPEIPKAIEVLSRGE